MAKRKRNRNRGRSQPVVAKSLEQQEIDAQRWLEGGHYKESIAAYKRLLQTEHREDWQRRLAEAYLRRAEAIAAKHMYQEAAVLWKNHYQLSHDLGSVEQYFQWLMLAAKPGSIAVFLKQQRAQLPSALVQRVQTLLGALLLADEKIAASDLIDELGTRDYPLARAALEAYCAGDDETLAAQLGRIGYRSPYRDFKTLLNALQAFATGEANKAQQLLDKIPAASVYGPMAQLCRQQRLDSPQALRDYLSRPAEQQSLQRCFAGLDKAQQNMLKGAEKALSSNSPKLALNTVIKHRALFGHEQSKAFCLATALEYPAGHNQFRRVFELDSLEYYRMKALSLESEDPELASDCWEDFIAALWEQAAPDAGLKVALIRRRIAGLLNDCDPDEAIEQLQSSLEYDPDDKETYLQLYQLQWEAEERRAASKTLSCALQQLPRDIDILLLSLNDSMRRKAFKKAAGYARTILDMDPINIKAQEGLLGCHRAHARKQIKAGKYALAGKELASAVAVESERARNGKLPILQGLLALREGDDERCGSLLQAGVEQSTGALHGYFLACIETLLVGLRIAAVMKHSQGLDPDYRADTPELLALLADLERYHQNYPQQYSSAFAKIKKPLKQSLAKQMEAMSDDQRLRLCDYFERLTNYELLRFVCKLDGEHESQYSLFAYYRMLGKTDGGSKPLAFRDRMALEHAARHAHQQGETGTLHKITRLLERCSRAALPLLPRGGFPLLPFADDPGFDSDVEEEALLDEAQVLFEQLEEGGVEAIIRLLFDDRIPTQQELIDMEQQGPEAMMNRILEKIAGEMDSDGGQQDLF